jgi:three-Cys-motif partner protein
MSTEEFFDETREQSLIKAIIVSKYFNAWTKVMLPQAKKWSNKIAYIDLFAGTGFYKDGTKSTPILILEKAIENDDLREILVTIFNDKDPEKMQSLKAAISALPGINTLKYTPRIENEEVGEEITKMLEEMNLIPTLFFVDPWGYKGLSLRLIGATIKNWGCDCVFFFNYNRINAGLNNLKVEAHMNSLFGEERTKKLRAKLERFSPFEREAAIIEELAEALKEVGGNFVLPFCFKNDSGTRTSHHLIFVSKHPKGCEIMKDIMAKESNDSSQDVPSFMYCPATQRQTLLFEFSRTIDELGQMLMVDFAGRTLTTRQIYEEHNIGTRFILKNYQTILKQLETSGKVKTDPPAEKRKKIKEAVTFGKNVKVTFPARDV